MRLMSTILATLVHLLALEAAWGQVVNLDQGTLRGLMGRSRNGSVYLRFLGIPYAEPPVGELRFKAPRPHSGWTGERNATSFASECPQRGVNFLPAGSEDCLYLNVYTPKIEPSAKLPVLVHFHGGAFKIGSAQYFQEKFLMDKKVVLVTFNYRIGILGFMSFLDATIPGNQGLRDQIQALRWVGENIDRFGGDPDHVTLWGSSAGAASVDYLLVSPLAQGLFRNVIMQGGSANSPWAFIPQPQARQRAAAAATLLGCPSQPTSDTLACLRQLPGEAFVTATEKFLEWEATPIGPFAPVVDSFLGNASGLAVIPDHPLALPPNPDVKVVLGFNSHEGNMIASVVCYQEFRLAQELERDWARKLTLLTSTQDQTNFTEKVRLATMMTEFYLGGKRVIGPDTVQKLAEMGTDIIFGHPAFKATLNYYRRVPVYFFLYDVEPLQPLISVYGNCSHLKGPSHGEENLLYFNDVYPGIPVTSEDHQISHQLLDLWVQFASTGVPSQGWTPVSTDHIEYLHMTRAGFTMKSGLRESRMRFVDSLPLINNQYQLRHPGEKTEL